MSIWHDTRCAGQGAIPDGLTEIDADELTGAIHPADDPELSGVESPEPNPSPPRETEKQARLGKPVRRPPRITGSRSTMPTCWKRPARILIRLR